MKMKKKLMETLFHLRERKVNLQETPALFQWTYEEEPNIFFEMLIKEIIPSTTSPGTEVAEDTTKAPTLH
jgi:hypothetical protein